MSLELILSQEKRTVAHDKNIIWYNLYLGMADYLVIIR